jgi:hypothetical protein
MAGKSTRGNDLLAWTTADLDAGLVGDAIEVG